MVDYKVDGQFAVLEVNNPPVNSLSHHVRVGLLSCIKKANADTNVKCVIIIGKGRTFIAGADIKEFGKGMQDPSLVDVGEAIEGSVKPVVSALHGTALGGGLEIGLFSHYRVADKNTKVGFPEVKLGLLPGAQGTVRLPRVAGVAVAMNMISSGQHINASEALKHGIIDTIVEGDLLNGAKLFARSIINKQPRRLSEESVVGAGDVDRLYEDALKEAKMKYKGMIAPVTCLKAVNYAAKLSFKDAKEMESKLFHELMSSSQSAALRYSFFADRSAPKWSLPNGANFSNTKPIQIKSVGVIGAGTMGSGIAVCLVRVGIPVILIEKDQKMLQKGIQSISRILKRSVVLKRMTNEQFDKSMRILQGAQSLDKLNNVDLVIEAVFENLALKREIFSKLDEICKPDALLCTNTSTIDIDTIASATSRPDKVVGVHFFAPAFVMKLLENVYGSKTSPTTVASVMQLGQRIGKIPVLVRTCHGFVANRMNQKLGSEATFLVEEGALPQDVDNALEELGMSMGVFRVSDLSGIDVGWRIRQEVAKGLGQKLSLETRFLNGERYSSLSDRLYELGRYGQKTGNGWYRYESPMAKTAYPDPAVTDIIITHCKSLGIERRKIQPQEIVERCLYAAVNEGFRILEEGVAEKPEDIDVIWQYGFSFPRHLGGPMFYASQVGLKRIYDRICHYHSLFPYSSYWLPSDMLKKLASHDAEIPLSKWTNYGNSKL